MTRILQNPKDRFTSRVQNYVKFRPSYPPSVISLLREQTGNNPDTVVADLGSGTGIFTRLLLDAGFTVYAVEPNHAMRYEAETSLKECGRFHSIDGEAAATRLRDSSIDAITAAQAFHWFATEEAITEFLRILKPEGVVMLIWNDRKTDCDRFHVEYEDLLLRYGTDYSKVNHRNITEDRVRSLFKGWECTVGRIGNFQVLDFEGLKGRVESSSYCPPQNHPTYLPLLKDLELLFKRECKEGTIRIEYECVVFVLRPVVNEASR